jgi:hypothetical protein
MKIDFHFVEKVSKTMLCSRLKAKSQELEASS